MAFESHSESIGDEIPACAFGEHSDAYSGIESRLEVKKGTVAALDVTSGRLRGGDAGSVGSVSCVPGSGSSSGADSVCIREQEHLLAHEGCSAPLFRFEGAFANSEP